MPAPGIEYTERMTTVRKTYTVRSLSARTRLARVVRQQRKRTRSDITGPDTRTPMEKRLDEMRREGTLVPSSIPPGPRGRFPTIATVPGALERFLAERHRPWE